MIRIILFHNFLILDIHMKKINFGEIFNIYRRNCNYKFLNDIAFEAAVFEKNKISFPSETYFSD